MKKNNPLNLNPLQLKTLTLLQAVAEIEEVAQKDPATGHIKLTALPHAHGNHFHVGRYTVDAVTLRPPAVLVDQHRRIAPPALVGAAQAIEHAQDAAIDSGHAQRVLEIRAGVRDAQLQGREPAARPQVPPQLGAVLDEAGTHQYIQVPLVLAPGIEDLR